MNIENIKGVGPSIIKKFEKIGIKTIDELITYYPFRYEVIERSNIDELLNDDKIIDNEACKFGVAVKIEKFEDFYQD